MAVSAAEILNLVTKGTGEVGTPLVAKPQFKTPQEQAAYTNQLKLRATDAEDVVDLLEKDIKQQKEQEQQMPESIKSIPLSPILSNKKIFSLAKYAQMPMNDPSMRLDQSLPTEEVNDPATAQPSTQGTLQFVDANAVRNYLESTDINEATSSILDYVDDQKIEDPNIPGSFYNPKQVISDSLRTYMEGKETMSDQEKLEIATRVFDALPSPFKSPQGQEDSFVLTQQKVAQVVEDTNNEIRKIAERLASKDKGANVFNLKKIAQHKSFENVMLVGPGQTKLDAFTGNLISDLHVIERNKGFGLKVDNVLNIDWEAIWRGTVMDKYSRPYRDKDGKWVGGYLNKRFEINQFVPEGNSYQLKPGQKRAPILKEFGNLGSRLNHLHESGEGEKRGYGPKVASTVFNLKKNAEQKKKRHQITSEKTAQLKPMKDLEDPFSTKEEKDSNRIATSKKCPSCGSDCGPNDGKCQCGFILTGVLPIIEERKPDPRGKRPKRQISVTPNQPMNQPMNQIMAQSVLPVKQPMMAKPKKPLEISDPEAENTNDVHMRNVDDSATALGL